MNIQPLGLPASLKLEERPTQATEPVAAQRQPAQAAPAPAAAPSRDEVAAAVKKINETMSASSQSLEFAVDDESKEIVVKIIDQDTKEVVRQIPSVEALEIAKSLDKMMGLLIRQTA
jgi:flagellar protein FlaG